MSTTSANVDLLEYLLIFFFGDALLEQFFFTIFTHQLPIDEDIMFAATNEVLHLCPISRDVCSGSVLDETFSPVTGRPRNRCNYLLDRWCFLNSFLRLLDGRSHKV